MAISDHQNVRMRYRRRDSEYPGGVMPTGPKLLAETIGDNKAADNKAQEPRLILHLLRGEGGGPCELGERARPSGGGAAPLYYCYELWRVNTAAGTWNPILLLQTWGE